MDFRGKNYQINKNMKDVPKIKDEKSERNKELNFLHNFSQLLREENYNMDKILKGTVKLLKTSFQHPEDVGACIIYKGREYKTLDYKETTWKISSNLELLGKEIGTIEVYYNKPPHNGQESFTKEEQLVLETIAEHLSRVAEQIQAKEDLQISKNELSITLDSIGDGVIVTDASMKVIRLNPQAEKITGWSEKEALGRSFNEVFHIENSETGEMVPDPVYQVIETGKIQILESDTILVARDGTRRHIADSAAPIRDYKDELFSVIMVFSDITESKEAEEKVRYQSLHDGFTGLYNRAYMEEEMERLDTDRQLPMGIIMADSNGLKFINDSFGHESGDEMLMQTAEILKSSCREEDIIARWGGDEFVILLPQTTEEEGNAICQRIEDKCKETYVKGLPISLSVGLAIKTNTNQVLEEKLREAEEIMYKRKFDESQSVNSRVVEKLLKDLEEKSFETEAHYTVMQNVAQMMGMKMGLSEMEFERLEKLILVHDIGQVSITEEIFNKEGALSAEEWEEIKKHSKIGYRIVHAIGAFANVAEETLSLHEHWEGLGYPQGLKGEAIPLLARITTVADAYEVMSSGRHYKKAMSWEDIIEEMKKCAGTQFDPEIIEIFLQFQEVDMKQANKRYNQKDRLDHWLNFKQSV